MFAGFSMTVQRSKPSDVSASSNASGCAGLGALHVPLGNVAAVGTGTHSAAGPTFVSAATSGPPSFCVPESLHAICATTAVAAAIEAKRSARLMNG